MATQKQLKALAEGRKKLASKRKSSTTKKTTHKGLGRTRKTTKKGLSGCFTDYEILRAVEGYLKSPFGSKDASTEYMKGFCEGANFTRKNALEIIEEMRNA